MLIASPRALWHEQGNADGRNFLPVKHFKPTATEERGSTSIKVLQKYMRTRKDDR